MITWLEKHMLSCAWKSLFGIDCPACGMQRSFIYLLKGDITASLMVYPPLPVVLLFFVALGLYIINKKIISKKIIATCSWLVLAVVLLNYVVKLVLFNGTHAHLS